MSDIFEETEETLRAQEWTRIAKKSAPWAAGIAGLALAGALGFWGFTTWQDKEVAKASEVFQAGIEAAAKGDSTAAKASFEQTAKGSNSTYKAMSLMQLAGLAHRDGKTDEAIKLFDDAAKASSDPRVADLAALKAAYLVMDKGVFADSQKRLTPLTDAKRPYTFLAKEALAMAKLQNGDAAGARADLNALSFELDAPEGVKQRAQRVVAAIDFGVAPTVKSILALPEAETPTLPGGLPPGLNIPQQ
ncbi:TPR repeat-containing protein [Asticcacaulis biprosthecium C19]|uniref:TPR repeat-containing protein n=1 Tax=Asticcacaulis biprosthecium C19 TaxID=715226 RepID=F4QR49_9CAUL|nr:tetratricopeptide repeat protein [Asticcacaulis biprosthecium]EGF90686.1 TPR repeat-containing protein [Asticcacaulis biprosthecium C19]